MCTLLKDLKEYFRTTPREKILEDWEKTSKFDNVKGPVIPFSNFSVGDRVYCSIHKKYGIVNDEPHVFGYPVKVIFEDGEGVEYYTEDGRIYEFEKISLSIPFEEKLNKLMKL